MDAADSDTAHIVAVVERGDEHLRVTIEGFRGGNILYNGVENGIDVVNCAEKVGGHPALLGAAVDCREIELIFSGIEIEHQVKDHLLNLVGTAIWFVDLVDYENRLQADLNGFFEHKTRLGAWPRRRRQARTAVGHIEHALYLSAEVSVSRSVDNIDFDAVVVDRNIL